MKKTYLVIGLLFSILFLSGCATTPSDPTPEKRQAEITKFKALANNPAVSPEDAAVLSYSLADWAYKGWGTKDGKKDKQEYYFWLNESVNKGSIHAAVELGGAYINTYVTGKYEPDRVIELITPAYNRYLSGVMDRYLTKDVMSQTIAEGLTFRGEAYHLKGNDLDARKDFCRAIALDPKNIVPERQLIGGYGRANKCDEYLRM